jgi:hypothetical protein
MRSTITTITITTKAPIPIPVLKIPSIMSHAGMLRRIKRKRDTMSV